MILFLKFSRGLVSFNINELSQSKLHRILRHGRVESADLHEHKTVLLNFISKLLSYNFSGAVFY